MHAGHEAKRLHAVPPIGPGGGGGGDGPALGAEATLEDRIRFLVPAEACGLDAGVRLLQRVVVAAGRLADEVRAQRGGAVFDGGGPGTAEGNRVFRDIGAHVEVLGRVQAHRCFSGRGPGLAAVPSNGPGLSGNGPSATLLRRTTWPVSGQSNARILSHFRATRA